MQLPTYARHQHRWFYCGPAVVQVISNYTYGYRNATVSGETSNNNVFLQSYISGRWTRTDANGQTNLGDLITGLNASTSRPSYFYWAQWHGPSFADFHAAIVNDVFSYKMPLAAGVNPHVRGSTYYLYSWRNWQGSTGHYITINGYSGVPSSSSKYAYYNDSSGGYDEVQPWIAIAGETGAFSDTSYTVYMTMKNNSGDLVY
ncbi:MAG: hypothetical protein DLM71_10435 [Chloroflexi bacterium]|nr:MAG: hypothetical protein DLM71_10435 [Chloroflexota bacterium]